MRRRVVAGSEFAPVVASDILDCPALGAVYGLLDGRAAPESEFAIPADLFDAAKAEMAEVMRKRGFPLPQRPLPFPFENFIVRGVTVLADE